MKKETGKKVQEGFGEWQFINFSWTDSLKLQAEAWIDKADVAVMVEREIGNGYKFSLSMDQKKGRFISTISQKEGENAMKLLTARAGGVFTALGRVLFLHVVVFECGAWGDQESADDLW